MARPVIVVGGGLAGLAAAIYLARGGRKVTLFEKRRTIGGRAITYLRRGFRFNLGPHALARRGLAWRVYRELGVPVSGVTRKPVGNAVFGDVLHKLPASLLSILTTSLLDFRGKVEAARLLFRIRRLDSRPFAPMTVGDWLDREISNEGLRDLMRVLLRVATYSPDLDQNAAVALGRLRDIMRGIMYVDEGWQKLVDGLYSRAVTSGVNFITSSRVIGVQHGDGVRGVEIGGLENDPDSDVDTPPDEFTEHLRGTLLQADEIVLAVDPSTARRLLGNADFTAPWSDLRPVTLACLDVALSKLPQPHRILAISVDQPLYLSVHSAYAQLAPRDGALIHVAKFRSAGAPADSQYEEETIPVGRALRSDEPELEAFLDQIQPGWRDVVVHRRFMPSMTVSNAAISRTGTRPDPATPLRGLYIAGDWVGSAGCLSDAALWSARTAAKAILGQ